MDRRGFIRTCTSALVLAPSLACAQATGKMYRIGFLGGLGPMAPQSAHLFDGFFQGMRELGYVEGRDFIFEGRYYGDRPDRLPGLADELIRLNVDVIVTGSPPAPEAAQRATSTIPIVMVLHPDPVGGGLAVSLARPGRNVTGLSTVTKDSVGKRLQLLKEAVPRISRVAVLLDPAYPASPLELGEAEIAARSLNLSLRVHEVRSPGDFARAFAAMTRDRADALTTIGGNLFFIHRTQIAELASQTRLPSIHANKEYAGSGALMAYGPDSRDRFRRAATYVDRILKGAKPGDLPIEQATSFHLTINLRTAKALGLTMPQALLSRADELIQ